MDVEAYNAGYYWMKWAIDTTWLFWAIVGPLVIMRITLKFLGWTHRRRRGTTMVDFEDGFERTYHTGLRGRMDRWRNR